MRSYGRKLKPLARELRKNQKECERRLWSRLRRKQLHGVQFYRQKPVGNYIVDFYAPVVGLVIEDGSQHLESEARRRDDEKSKNLEKAGLFVIRVGNEDVVGNIDGVVEYVAEAIRGRLKSNPPQSPFFKGGG